MAVKRNTPDDAHPREPLGFIRPMLAQAATPFDSPDYLFEVKWDGIRALACVEPDSYRIWTRHRRDVTEQFPELAGLTQLGSGLVFDGELVVLKAAKPCLRSVQSRHLTTDPRKIRRLAHALPAVYLVFDVLYIDHRSVMRETLAQRRLRLQKTLAQADDPRLVLSEGVIGDGTALFAGVCRLGLEGIMAKHLASRYRPGRRSRAWLKISACSESSWTVLPAGRRAYEWA